MSDELRERIAAVQLEHVDGQLTNYDTGREECGCGRQGSATYREHLADAILAIPGIAVVELPEPDDPSPPGEDERLRSPLAQWGGESGADFVASVWHLGEVQINQYVRHGWYEPMEPISPADARQFALALLAAAAYAEREQ